MRLKITMAALLAAGLLVAGCGGDDETSTTTTTATGATGATGASGVSGAQGATGLLPADFAANANAICKAGDKEINDAFKALGPGEPSQAEFDQAAGDTIVPSIQGQIDGIRALGEPDEGADELNTFLDDAQSVLDDVKADPSLLTHGNAFKDVNVQGKALGLDECG